MVGALTAIAPTVGIAAAASTVFVALLLGNIHLAAVVLLLLASSRGAALNLTTFGVDIGFLLTIGTAAMITCQQRIRLPKVARLAGSAILIGYTASALFSPNWAQVILRVPGRLSYLALALLAYLLCRHKLRWIDWLARATAIFHLGIIAVETVLNEAYFYQLWKTDASAYVAGRIRVSSTVADPNYLALTLILLSAILFALLRTQGRTGWRATLIPWALLAAVPLTFSRGAIVGLVVFIAYLILRGRSGLATRVVVVAGVCLLSMTAIGIDMTGPALERLNTVSADEASVQSRTGLQQLALDSLADSWVTGLGAGEFTTLAQAALDRTKPMNIQTDVLNTYLFVWLEAGAIGLLGLVILCFAVVRRLGQAHVAAGGLWLGALVAMAFLDGFTLPMFWIATGVAFGVGPAPQKGQARPLREASDRPPVIAARSGRQ